MRAPDGLCFFVCCWFSHRNLCVGRTEWSSQLTHHNSVLLASSFELIVLWIQWIYKQVLYVFKVHFTIGFFFFFFFCRHTGGLWNKQILQQSYHFQFAQGSFTVRLSSGSYLLCAEMCQKPYKQINKIQPLLLTWNQSHT